mmetsp:Transcript_15885/g.30445  ORF Transcript_15885/g.30445 Transcript_15885/m.30445 type:complete len:462 (-) Transcript_15885:115-1500(-)
MISRSSYLAFLDIIFCSAQLQQLFHLIPKILHLVMKLSHFGHNVMSCGFFERRHIVRGVGHVQFERPVLLERAFLLVQLCVVMCHGLCVQMLRSCLDHVHEMRVWYEDTIQIRFLQSGALHKGDGDDAGCAATELCVQRNLSENTALINVAQVLALLHDRERALAGKVHLLAQLPLDHHHLPRREHLRLEARQQRPDDHVPDAAQQRHVLQLHHYVGVHVEGDVLTQRVGEVGHELALVQKLVSVLPLELHERVHLRLELVRRALRVQVLVHRVYVRARPVVRLGHGAQEVGNLHHSEGEHAAAGDHHQDGVALLQVRARQHVAVPHGGEGHHRPVHAHDVPGQRARLRDVQPRQAVVAEPGVVVEVLHEGGGEEEARRPVQQQRQQDGVLEHRAHREARRVPRLEAAEHRAHAQQPQQPHQPHQLEKARVHPRVAAQPRNVAGKEPIGYGGHQIQPEPKL